MANNELLYLLNLGIEMKTKLKIVSINYIPRNSLKKKKEIIFKKRQRKLYLYSKKIIFKKKLLMSKIKMN